MAEDRQPRPTVHLRCGLPGAGKTGYARALEADLPAVRFTLDEWMLRLYPWSYDDPRYVARLAGCKDLIWDVAQQVLVLGHDVVLDWNQWSRARRSEWRGRAEAAGFPARLHYLATPIEQAIARVEARAANAVPGRHLLDDAAVRHLADILEVPDLGEGIDIVRVPS